MSLELQVDSGGDQFPVTGPAPRLSWTLPTSVGAVDGALLEAEVDGAGLPPCDVGPEHRFVPWPWEPLPSRAAVRWRVSVRGGDSEGRAGEVVSGWSAFEVGLADADWRARWISPVEGTDPGYGERPAHLLTAGFAVEGEVVRARLYATALGVYEAFVNGERAGTAVLNPGSTSYEDTLYAQVSDVTQAVRAGENRLEVVLSDGWFRGQVGAFRMPAGWGATLAARVELHLELADGTSQVVHSDATWTSARSSIARADLMAGQTTDHGLAVPDPRPVLVDQVTPPPITFSPAPPVRVVETRTPVRSWQTADDTWVLDFGQNASGWLRVEGLGPAGTRTVIDHGEHVGPDGDLDTSHLDSSGDGGGVVFSQRDEVVSDGVTSVFEPRHTVHGFQYARLHRRGAPLDPVGVTMQVVHTDLRRTGTFASSSPELNRLHEIAEWSFRGNAVDVPTDCPTRERLAWTGDYQVFVRTATRLYDVLGFSRKWLQSVRDDQLDDGRIPNFAPDGRRIKHHLDDRLAMMTGSAGWGDAIVAVPWELYRAYGDAQVLAENWASMVRWVDWQLTSARTTRHHSRKQRSESPALHEEYLWDGSFHWGEWTEPVPKGPDGTRRDPIKVNPAAWFMADKGEVGTAYLYRSATTLARIATILGHDDAGERYATAARKVLEAWRTEYLLADGRTVADTQAAYVRALSFGLVPAELRAAAAERLVELVAAAGGHLTTGFLSTGDLLPVLVETGHVDVAYDLLFQTTPPSWLSMVEQGATTIWEDWEGIDAAGEAHESLNHYSKGAVVRFLHTHVLGLRQDAGSIAWESFTVAPAPGRRLTWAEGTHESPQGTIAVRWDRDDEALRVQVTVPPGSACTLRLPGARPEVVVGPASVVRASSPDAGDVREGSSEGARAAW
ncbi:family 78 glycoside hydrolase catalytic domain [Isoptericola sp. F-RaC21]|uniref:family 78 glycoside hydrolase catalytic domain n=1 Tax=Isoptericola sp. F-RaC21 TaxID=3141452 RepID=UPI00315BF23F